MQQPFEILYPTQHRFIQPHHEATVTLPPTSTFVMAFIANSDNVTLGDGVYNNVLTLLCCPIALIAMLSLEGLHELGLSLTTNKRHRHEEPQWLAGLQIIRNEHLKLICELGSGPGYFLHAGQNKTRAVIVKVFKEAPTAEEQLENTIALSKRMMHPNVLRIEGRSQPGAMHRFITYENAHSKNAVGPLAMALKGDTMTSMTLGFKMVRPALFLSRIELTVPVRLRIFRYQLSTWSGHLFSIDARGANEGNESPVTTQEKNKDEDEKPEWHLFNALCCRVVQQSSCFAIRKLRGTQNQIFRLGANMFGERSTAGNSLYLASQNRSRCIWTLNYHLSAASPELMHKAPTDVLAIVVKKSLWRQQQWIVRLFRMTRRPRRKSVPFAMKSWGLMKCLTAYAAIPILALGTPSSAVSALIGATVAVSGITRTLHVQCANRRRKTMAPEGVCGRKLNSGSRSNFSPRRPTYGTPEGVCGRNLDSSQSNLSSQRPAYSTAVAPAHRRPHPTKRSKSPTGGSPTSLMPIIGRGFDATFSTSEFLRAMLASTSPPDVLLAASSTSGSGLVSQFSPASAASPPSTFYSTTLSPATAIEADYTSAGNVGLGLEAPIALNGELGATWPMEADHFSYAEAWAPASPRAGLAEDEFDIDLVPEIGLIPEMGWDMGGVAYPGTPVGSCTISLFSDRIGGIIIGGHQKQFGGHNGELGMRIGFDEEMKRRYF
ncbi:hypothetical protein C8R43DRAFT_940606 [Mycena crocata]|nr:hypothetical protein C8R43DRAFT_940606 [Mycena crocata]